MGSFMLVNDTDEARAAAACEDMEAEAAAADGGGDRGSAAPVAGDHRAHGRTLTVRKTTTGSYVLRVKGSTRARFGNTAQAREDIAHFEATGALPAPILPCF